jgi:hypothetical protein
MLLLKVFVALFTHYLEEGYYMAFPSQWQCKTVLCVNFEMKQAAGFLPTA